MQSLHIGQTVQFPSLYPLLTELVIRHQHDKVVTNVCPSIGLSKVKGLFDDMVCYHPSHIPLDYIGLITLFVSVSLLLMWGIFLYEIYSHSRQIMEQEGNS
jgi:hypothetical protein